uniref:Uncharacterized protein n=1 Tax=Palpitomonas bilix TaxID=652834 RepID=A0A7S3GAA5_9EUKA
MPVVMGEWVGEVPLKCLFALSGDSLQRVDLFEHRDDTSQGGAWSQLVDGLASRLRKVMGISDGDFTFVVDTDKGTTSAPPNASHAAAVGGARRITEREVCEWASGSASSPLFRQLQQKGVEGKVKDAVLEVLQRLAVSGTTACEEKETTDGRIAVLEAQMERMMSLTSEVEKLRKAVEMQVLQN